MRRLSVLPFMRARRWVSVGLLVGMSALAGCATPKPKNIDIPQAQLQEVVARRFPYAARWLDAIDITANAPRLTLQPGANTIGADIEISAADRLFGHNYRGALTVASGLRYEPMDDTVRFTGVKVSRFGVEGLPAAYAPETARLGALLAEQLLENYPIYTLPRDKAQMLKDAGLRITAMRITDAGLSISIDTATPAP
jgi:hypothetical protein